MSALDYWKGRFQAAGAKAQAQLDEALNRWRAEATPGSVSDRALSAVTELNRTLTSWRSALDRYRALLVKMGAHATADERAAYELRMSQYQTVAAPFYADSLCTDGGTDCLGAVPMVGIAVLVGTLAVGTAGTAWALAYGADAVSAYKATEVDLRELEIRWEAVQKGLLPGEALTAPTVHPSPPADAGKPWDPVQTGLMVLGGGVVLGTAGALAWYALRSK